MNTPHKAPVTISAGFLGSGNTTIPHKIPSQQRGTGRVHGPERGYVRCERRYLDDRRRTQRSR